MQIFDIVEELDKYKEAMNEIEEELKPYQIKKPGDMLYVSFELCTKTIKKIDRIVKEIKYD